MRADEIWQLTSRWAPQGTGAFITFLVDPMWEGNRRKGQGIWAVGCNAEFPRSQEDAKRSGVLRLKASSEEIGQFVRLVNAFRVSETKSAGS